jgi:hypothetical protein
VQLGGQARYDHLVALCRQPGIATPEVEYPVWTGPGGPLLLAPLFVLYDCSFRTPGAFSKQQSLERAYEADVVCTDEMLLHPDPHPTRDAWCRARAALTEARLDAMDPGLSTVLINHYPLVREPTRTLCYPEFAQ